MKRKENTVFQSRLEGKLEDIPGFNVGLSPCENAFCQAMRVKGDSICANCFAAQAAKHRPGIVPAHCHNHMVVPVDVFAETFINAAFARFNSHVEIAGSNDLFRMLALCKRNPHCQFSLWTKRQSLIRSFFKENRKPDNMRLVFSWHDLEKDNRDKHFQKRLKRWTDRENERGLWNAVFVVSEEGVFNCGKRQCKDCQQCYGLLENGQPIKVITEKRK